MINEFIKNSRVTLESGPAEIGYGYFQFLIELGCKTHVNIQKPIVKICYSLNRLCETFKFNDSKYILYDQYLGQTLNKMNRILFHEDEEEALAYLCKVLSEENYILNNVSKTIAYNSYYQTNSKAKASDLPKEFLLKKYEYISIQESFILFHEFAHAVVSADPNEILYAEDYLLTTERGKDILLLIQDHLKKNNLEPTYIKYFLEEVGCDLIATNFTFIYYKHSRPVKKAKILEAISAAFLFLRTIYDIKFKARTPRNLKKTFTFFMKLRYNVLRTYFDSGKFTKEDIGDVIDVYELWEEKFEANTLVHLTKDFEDKLLDIFKNKQILKDRNLAKKLLGV